MKEDNIARRRYMREFQRQRRGSKRSYRTEIEDLHLILAWQSREISEIQVAKLLGLETDRMALRRRRDQAVARGRDIADALSQHQQRPIDRLQDRLRRKQQEAEAIQERINEQRMCSAAR